MIAVIRRTVQPNEPCVVYWTGRVRLHVEIRTWCGEKLEADDAADGGVLQVPDDTKICKACKIGLNKARLDNAAATE